MHVCSALDPADSDERSRSACEDWLALQRALAFEPERACELLQRFESPGAVLGHTGPWVQGQGAAASDRESLARIGGRILPWPSDLYPERLRALPDAPPVLCVRGEVALLGRPAVAIVGARAATAHGLETARMLAAALARRGLVVVSGLARGIDAAAHRAALEVGGRTVAVQACGLDRIYPPEHRALADAIAESGAVVSELPMGTPPRAVHFPLRNRVISGLSSAVGVVEARLRSGSLVTARHALAQGRDVLAVPGPLRTPASEGPNQLLRDGARPLLDVDDVLAALPERVLTGLVPLPVDAQASARRPRAQRAGSRPLDARDRLLLAALEHEARARDALTRELSWTVSEVAARLLSLELDGHVVQDRDGRFRRRHRPGEPEAAADLPLDR